MRITRVIQSSHLCDTIASRGCDIRITSVRRIKNRYFWVVKYGLLAYLSGTSIPFVVHKGDELFMDEQKRLSLP